MASSRGKEATERLRANVEEQLNRLVQQLKDLEDMKDEMSADELREQKADTVQQMKEFHASLQKMLAGNMTLVDQFGSIQLAIQAAVSQAFKTPEVIALFAKKGTGQLRTRLANLQRDVKLGKLSDTEYTAQAVEILSALKKLDQTLSAEETQFLADNMTQSMVDFEKADATLGGAAQANVISMASRGVQRAQD